MAKSHNKKRNTGIIYEQLLREMSSAMVVNDLPRVKKVSNIIKSHFQPGTQLYREFRLFTALLKTNAKSEMSARRILGEAKNIASLIDANKLRGEKNLLIKELNQEYNGSIFKYRIPTYKLCATIQTLVNDWRSKEPSDISKIVEYEEKLIDWILQEKNQSQEPLKHGNIDELVYKIMRTKFNEKYSNILSNDQSEIIREYVFSSESGDQEKLLEVIDKVYTSAKENLDNFAGKCDNSYLSSKIPVVAELVQQFDSSVINDDQIKKILVLSQLNGELESKDKE